MSRFMTDVVASRAFGMHGNSFTEPDAEFSRQYNSTFHMSVRKALLMLTAFFAPYLTYTYFFKPNIVFDCTESYFRKIKFYSHQLMHFFIQPCISLLSYIKIT